MAGPRCVNALDGFMVLTLEGPSHGEHRYESPVESRRRSGGVAIQRDSGVDASAAHRRDRLIASTVHGDDLVKSADPKNLVYLFR